LTIWLKPCEPRTLIAGVERGLAKRAEFLRRQDLVGLMEQTVFRAPHGNGDDDRHRTWRPRPKQILHAGDLAVDRKRPHGVLGQTTP